MLPGLVSQRFDTGRCGLVGLRGAAAVEAAEGAASRVDRVGRAEADLVDRCPGRCGRFGGGCRE